VNAAVCSKRNTDPNIVARKTTARQREPAGLYPGEVCYQNPRRRYLGAPGLGIGSRLGYALFAQISPACRIGMTAPALEQTGAVFSFIGRSAIVRAWQAKCPPGGKQAPIGSGLGAFATGKLIEGVRSSITRSNCPSMAGLKVKRKRCAG